MSLAYREPPATRMPGATLSMPEERGDFRCVDDHPKEGCEMEARICTRA